MSTSVVINKAFSARIVISTGGSVIVEAPLTRRIFLGTVVTGVVQNADNVGTGADVFKELGSDSRLKFRSITATDLTVTENTDDVNIAHGAQAGGSLHAAATASAAGFLSAADKAALDALPAYIDAGDATLAAAVTAEAAARAAADTAEATARAAAVTAEATTRATADAALSTALTNGDAASVATAAAALATHAALTAAHGATSANTASTIVSRDSSGNFSAGAITASLAGNASTATLAAAATILANTRTINGVSFNGSANITITASTTAALSLGSHLAYDAGSTFDGGTARTLSTDAASANTVSTLVARDGSGNFAAGTITASLTGLASLNLPLTGGTLSGNLLFSADGAQTIGASNGTRPKGAFLGANVAGWGYFAEIAVANTGGPILALNKARGSLGAETSPNSGDQLGTVYFQGWNGTDFAEGVKVQAVTTEAWDATHNGAELLLRTVSNGSTTAVTRWRIMNDGQFVAGADNTYDIGSPSLRPRSAYLGTSLTIGAHAVLTATQSFGSTAQLVINSDLGTNVAGNGIRVGTADTNGFMLYWKSAGKAEFGLGDASDYASLNVKALQLGATSTLSWEGRGRFASTSSAISALDSTGSAYTDFLALNYYVGASSTKIASASDGVLAFTNNGATQSATVTAAQPVTPRTGDLSVPLTAANTLYTNAGASGQVVFTLPAAAAGVGPFTFYVAADTKNVRVTAGTGDTIRIGSTATASAGHVDCSTIGGSLTLVGIAANTWVATSMMRNWSLT